MKFPIQSAISPEPYGPTKTGALLVINGNAGQIPPAFQWAVMTATTKEAAAQLCDQGVSAMNDEQWDAWIDQDSETYILECVAANLALKLMADAEAKPATTTTKKTRR